MVEHGRLMQLIAGVKLCCDMYNNYIYIKNKTIGTNINVIFVFFYLQMKSI